MAGSPGPAAAAAELDDGEAVAKQPVQAQEQHALKQPGQEQQPQDVLRQHQAIVAQACRKLNRLMLPFALLFSIIASLDRANLSFASVSMSQELGFSAVDYGLGSAIFFISYSLFQIPSNICFIYCGGRRMLGAIAVSWGLVAASMAAVNSRGAFLAVRFLLGIAEAGTVPGIWAYLSSVYPTDHLTLPTTFYMAGITAAQALGAPLAAGLLTLHGAGNMSGWRWLFVIEGAPAVLLGVAIWLFLPANVSQCKLLTPLQQQHLQAAIDCTIPVAAASGQELPDATASKTAVLAADLGSRASSSSDSGSSCCDTGSSSSGSAKLGLEVAGLPPCSSSKRPDGTARPSRQQLLADLAAAARCRVVWCSSFWRFLYLLTLNGLIFWVPLIVHALLDVPTTAGDELVPQHEAAPASTTQQSSSDTRIMLLAAVPYVAGVAAHLVNAMHSHRVHERRFHIAVPWLLGGLLLLALPVAWMHNADAASYTLLVLASMCIMSCDGIDVTWIVSLMSSLSASQTTLALAYINTTANIGSVVGAAVIGALKQSSGSYSGGIWMMGGVMCFAALLVTMFPMSWASQCQECHLSAAGGKSSGQDLELSSSQLGCGCKGVASSGGGKDADC